MPKINWPSEEERSKYRQLMRDRLKTLPPDEHRGFFPIGEQGSIQRDAAFGRLSTPLYSYIMNAPNGLSAEERRRLNRFDTPTYISQTLFSVPDERLDHLLDLKCLLESTAENGRTHFENMIDNAYANNISEDYLKVAIQAMNEDLCLNLQVPEIQLNRVPNPGLQNRRDQKKSGLEWISEFKAQARQGAAAEGTPRDTDWIINTLAVRSLLRSERHKSDNLTRPLAAKEIMERANRLMADPGVRGYITMLANSPQNYARAAELLQKGNGGRVEDQLSAYMVANKQVSFSQFGMRYRPTAKQMIELMQATLKKPDSTPEEKQEALASIIAVRKSMNIKRASMGLVGDDALKEQIADYSGFQRFAGEAAQRLQQLSSPEQYQLIREACSGHGGAMVKSFDKMLDRNVLDPMKTQAERKEWKPIQNRF